MIRSITAAAMVGALSLATVPALTSAALAQAAAPEPPHGAQPMDGPASADTGSTPDKGAMVKKSSKHAKKHKKSM